MNKMFKVVKEIKDHGDTIPVGSEITILNGRIYFNSGQIMPGVYNMFRSLIEAEVKNPHYLREVPIPYNKV